MSKAKQKNYGISLLGLPSAFKHAGVHFTTFVLQKLLLFYYRYGKSTQRFPPLMR